MKSTGIVRKIDNLGRIVLPKELKKTLNINIGDPIDILIDGNNIILNKFKVRACIYCKTRLDAENKYCSECGKKIE